MAALMAAGHAVLMPFGVRGYDLAFEDSSGRFYRVQVKTARMRGGVMRFDAFSKSGSLRDKRTSYEGRADFFGVYLPPNGQCYLIPVGEIRGTEGWFRIAPPKNNQAAGVRFAEQFLIQPG
jgi:PD-(D/E)XK endonuclease